MDKKIDRELWFIHIPKCGGTSVKKALGIDTGHEPLISKVNSMDIEHWKNSFSFAFVRNPYERLGSLYRFYKREEMYGVTEDMSFRDWFFQTIVKQNKPYFGEPWHFMPCFEWLTLNRKGIHVDFVGKLEDIEMDFFFLTSILGVNAKIERKNKTNGSVFYDREMLSVMQNWFIKDFSRWYPGFCYYD